MSPFFVLLLLHSACAWPETRYPEMGIQNMNPHTYGIPTITQDQLTLRFECGEPGYGEERVQASIDYNLCCKHHGTRCCAECKCQWAQYYEMASRCFDSFLTYKRDVMTGLEKWNKDASLYCKVSDMGNKYASHEENNVWRAEHLADDDVKFRNIALEDTRRGYDGAEKKEWCGSAASHGPSTLVMLLVCATASIALLVR